jgi:hypothetical protein
MNEKKVLEKPYERFEFSLKTTSAGTEYYFDKLNEVQGTLSWKSGQKTRMLSASTYILSSQK